MAIPSAVQAVIDPILDQVATARLSTDDAARLATLQAIQALIMSTGDINFANKSAQSYNTLIANNQLDAQDFFRFSGWMRYIDGYLKSVGGGAYISLASYLTYLNSAPSGSPLSYLVLPTVADLWNLAQSPQFATPSVGRSKTFLLPAAGVAPPATILGVIGIGPSAHQVTPTLGSVIRSANNSATAAGWADAQGYVGAKSANATVTTAINGTLTLTLIMTGQTNAGVAVANRTWTVVLDNAAAGAIIPLVPANAGDRIYSFVSVTAAGTATAGNVTIATILDRTVSGPAMSTGSGTNSGDDAGTGAGT